MIAHDQDLADGAGGEEAEAFAAVGGDGVAFGVDVDGGMLARPGGTKVARSKGSLVSLPPSEASTGDGGSGCSRFWGGSIFGRAVTRRRAGWSL